MDPGAMSFAQLRSIFLLAYHVLESVSGTSFSCYHILSLPSFLVASASFLLPPLAHSYSLLCLTLLLSFSFFASDLFFLPLFHLPLSHLFTLTLFPSVLLPPLWTQLILTPLYHRAQTVRHRETERERLVTKIRQKDNQRGEKKKANRRGSEKVRKLGV